MPTYQYACTSCGEQLEAVQSFTDAPLSECPVCGGALRKVFSAVGVVFKGSGFYKTDSRAGSSSGGDRKKADGSDSSTTKSDSTTSGDSGKSGGDSGKSAPTTPASTPATTPSAPAAKTA